MAKNYTARLNVLGDFLVELAKVHESGVDYVVESYSGGEWHTMEHPGALCVDGDYRVKRKFVTGWVNVYEDGSIGRVCPSQEKADAEQTPNRVRCIQVAEL